MEKFIISRIEESIVLKQNIINNRELLQNLALLTEACIRCFKEGGKVLFCGNGGSAADAQHLAAELSGKFMVRPSIAGCMYEPSVQGWSSPAEIEVKKK